MRKIKSHFKFNKQERSGIFFLLTIIVLLQIIYIFSTSILFQSPTLNEVFELDKDLQTQVDILKKNSQLKDSVKIYPFNPNYITDYKGYKLGMSVEEIDRLHAFRSSNKFVNSIEEFQAITLISDSLLQKMAPYFKFPDWVVNAQLNQITPKSESGVIKTAIAKVVVEDLNTATAEDLKVVYGIGDKLSERIVKFRDRLGGFLIEDQLYDVYGLEADVAQKVLLKYKVLTKPEIIKININKATASEISRLVYLNYDVSKKIVAYRNEVGEIKSFEELRKIDGFPSDKINRITLYLAL